MSRHRIVQWMAVTVVGFVASAVKADYVITFTDSNFDGSQNFGTLTIADHSSNPAVAAGSVRFTFQVNPSLLPPGAQFGEIAVNTSLSAAVIGAATFSGPSGWSAENPGNLDARGSFNFGAIENGAADRLASGFFTLSGLGSDALISNFTNANASGNYAAAHLFFPDSATGLPNGNTGYISGGQGVITNPVPAPPALALGLVGAAGLFGRRAWARRRTPAMA
jgi:hypothetical protein